MVRLTITLVAALPRFSALAQHLHAVGTNLGGISLLAAGLVGPLAGAQAAFHIDLATLAQVLADDFSQTAIEYNAVEFCCLLVFTAVLVTPSIGGSNGHICHLTT